MYPRSVPGDLYKNTQRRTQIASSAFEGSRTAFPERKRRVEGNAVPPEHPLAGGPPSREARPPATSPGGHPPPGPAPPHPAGGGPALRPLRLPKKRRRPFGCRPATTGRGSWAAPPPPGCRPPHAAAAAAVSGPRLPARCQGAAVAMGGRRAHARTCGSARMQREEVLPPYLPGEQRAGSC